METIIRLCDVLMGKPRNAWCIAGLSHQSRFPPLETV